ncbi:aminodeoxychorismate synthase component I [Candidatus Peregrinibacteria bacterium]|nr:aminodeoxychorismate synthase component I [Candidatus Peregrinibacteria bacterium]
MQCILEKEAQWVSPVCFFEMVRGRDAILLHSAGLGRYSIIGFDPFHSMRNEPFDRLQTFLENLGVSQKKKFLPDIPFIGGAMGFVSYDYGAGLQSISQKVRDDLQCPGMYFLFPGKVAVFDHEKQVMYVISWGVNRFVAETGLKDLREIISKTFSKFPQNIFQVNHLYNVDRERRKKSESLFRIAEKIFSKKHSSKPVSNLTFEQYCKKIQRVQEYLQSGDTYQVNFSQRFSAKLQSDPWDVYKRVTNLNPSPFQAFLETPDFSVVCNSPERLVRVFEEEDYFFIETRPIKGTMPRGKTPQEDEVLRQALLASDKDRAELVMIVDLARNDLGRVSVPGSVEVNDDRVIEGYSHVWHTLSNVRGRLRKDVTFPEVFRAVFPGGSVTGCPKKRTMEIIDELEDFRRGVYTGSMGYIGFDGRMDFNIMIRTLFVKNKMAYFHVGGGIVSDSDPTKEYQETLDKAGALLSSLS